MEVRASGRPEEGNDDGTMPPQKSDLFVVAKQLTRSVEQ